MKLSEFSWVNKYDTWLLLILSKQFFKEDAINFVKNLSFGNLEVFICDFNFWSPSLWDKKECNKLTQEINLAWDIFESYSSIIEFNSSVL